MKKLIALTLAVVMLCTVSLAFAKTFEPEGQLAGKTLHATVGAYDPETKTFTVTVYEYDRFGKDTAGDLAAGDTILVGGRLYTIAGQEDLDGTTVWKSTDGEEIVLGSSGEEDDDSLIARSTMDDRIFMHVTAVLHLPAAEGIVFEDNSNPDLDAEPVVTEGLDAILKVKAEKEETSNGFDFYATTVTLNENLEIVKIHQDFDVAQ